jgi:hypothetical protein
MCQTRCLCGLAAGVVTSALVVVGRASPIADDDSWRKRIIECCVLEDLYNNPTTHRPGQGKKRYSGITFNKTTARRRRNGGI